MVTQERKQLPRLSASFVAKTAILTALSFILYMFVKFPLPLFPTFLDIQISDLPALVGGFALGPFSGCLIIVIKCLLKMPFTSTACVGEIADILIGIAFVLPSALIYKNKKSIKFAFIGLCVGIVSSVIMSILANWLILIPFYVSFMFDGQWEPLLNMCKILNENITTDNFYSIYLFAGILPFNLIRCVLTALLTYFAYKPVHKLFNKF